LTFLKWLAGSSSIAVIDRKAAETNLTSANLMKISGDTLPDIAIFKRNYTHFGILRFFVIIFRHQKSQYIYDKSIDLLNYAIPILSVGHTVVHDLYDLFFLRNDKYLF
jgi:hypothetical protein